MTPLERVWAAIKAEAKNSAEQQVSVETAQRTVKGIIERESFEPVPFEAERFFVREFLALVNDGDGRASEHPKRAEGQTG